MTFALADTNLFLRYLIDGHEHHAKAKAIFHKVQAKQLRLIWTPVVFVEVVHVLGSPKLFALSRAEISALLEPLLNMPSLKVEEQAVARQALTIFTNTKLDIEDAWIAARAVTGKVKTVCTFDGGFKAVAGIEILTP